MFCPVAQLMTVILLMQSQTQKSKGVLALQLTETAWTGTVFCLALSLLPLSLTSSLVHFSLVPKRRGKASLDPSCTYAVAYRIARKWQGTPALLMRCIILTHCTLS